MHAHLGEVQHHVRRDVVRGVVNFVEQLFFDPLCIHPSAGVRGLGDDEATIGMDLGNRKADVGGVRNVFVTGVKVITAGDLRATFEQVARRGSHGQLRPVIKAPAKVMDQWCQGQ